MKTIINGKKYDTHTAKEVCCGFFGNFNSKAVTLYRKKTGEFFYHHEDLANSREWVGPTTEKDAKEFAQEQMSVDKYETYFREVEE